jgi:hypothetical protein
MKPLGTLKYIEFNTKSEKLGHRIKPTKSGKNDQIYKLLVKNNYQLSN